MRHLGTIVACGAAAALLILAAPASSGTRTYTGTADADPTTSFSLEVKRAKGKRWLTSARTENLALTCGKEELSARLGSARLSGRVRIGERGGFAAKASNELQTVALRGRLSGRIAHGTFRYYGFTDVGGETMGCDSGKVRFTVAR